jgi:hypothetical protein
MCALVPWLVRMLWIPWLLPFVFVHSYLVFLFPWNEVGYVYIKVQQQTTWDEIPEKTNSSSSLTKSTLCSFIKILRAPNPKPGVH